MIPGNRFESKQKLNRFLKRYYSENSTPIGPDESLPRIEEAISVAIGRPFDSVESKERFVENLRMLCVIHRLEFLVNPRPRGLLRSNLRVSEAMKLRNVAKKCRNRDLAGPVVSLADSVLERESLRRTHLTWTLGEAKSSLAFRLDGLFRGAGIFRKRWEAIAALIRATFDLAEDRDGRYGGEWARQLVGRNPYARNIGLPAQFAEDAEFALIEWKCADD